MARSVCSPRVAFYLGCFALAAFHLGLLSYFEPPSVLFGSTPISGCDFDTHIEQTWRVLEGLNHWGRSWVYDVHLLAGHPNGVIFDADNKGWELLTYLLMRLGIRRDLAFNLFVVIAHLLVAPVVYGSARLLRSARGSALIAASLGSALWFFDSHLHWLWWVGTVAYVFSSYFVLLPIALFSRYCETPRVWLALSCAGSTALAHLIHPYSFFAMVVPMSLSYFGGFKTFSLRAQLGVVIVVTVTLAANAFWLLTAVEQWHYILDSSFIGQAKLSQLLADLAGLVIDVSTTGITPNRTALRFLCFGAAAAFFATRAASDRRLQRVGMSLLFLLLLAYCGGYLKITSELQPYRFIDPAMFLAVIPAAEFLRSLGRTESRTSFGPPIIAAAAVVFLLLSKQLVGEALGYFEDAFPPLEPIFNGAPAPIVMSGYKPNAVYRHDPAAAFYGELLPRWIEANAGAGGRILVQNGVIGEQLAWRTNAEILGGFIVRNLEHSRANIFRRHLTEHIGTEQMRSYLQAYAVEWLVLLGPEPWLENMTSLFEWYADVAGARILRTKIEVSRFERGAGVVSAVTNRITVSNTGATRELVLRYHYHEDLACSPNCRVEPFPNPVGGVPFIRVPAPHPSEFVIFNAYGRTRRD